MERTLTPLPFTTTCLKDEDNNSGNNNNPITEFVLVSIMCVVLLTFLLFFVYFTLQNRRAHRNFGDVVDLRDIMEGGGGGGDLQRLVDDDVVRPRHMENLVGGR